MVKQRRNRSSIGLSEEGVLAVRKHLSFKRLSQWEWSFQSHVSVSTAKRLLQGKAVDSSYFKALINTLELEISEHHLCAKPVSISFSPRTPKKSNTAPKKNPGIFMTVVFNQEDRFDVEVVVEHLRKLLIDSEVLFSEDGESVSLHGNFSEDRRKHVEMTIARLEHLSISCEKTISISSVGNVDGSDTETSIIAASKL